MKCGIKPNRSQTVLKQNTCTKTKNGPKSFFSHHFHIPQKEKRRVAERVTFYTMKEFSSKTMGEGNHSLEDLLLC